MRAKDFAAVMDFLNSLKTLHSSEGEFEQVSDDISVISSDILKDLSAHRTVEEDKLRSILLDIVFAIELLNNKTNANKSLIHKLDTLTAAMQEGNCRMERLEKTLLVNFDDDINNLIDRKRDLEWQYMRSDKLSSYYEDLLLHENEQYVPFEFRVKVRSDSDFHEKMLKKEKSVNNFKVEIRLMKETVDTCKRQLDHINMEIDNFLSSPSLLKITKEDHKTKIIQNEESNVMKLDNALKKVRRRCEKDLNCGAKQFLIRYIDKENVPRVRLFHDGVYERYNSTGQIRIAY